MNKKIFFIITLLCYIIGVNAQSVGTKTRNINHTAFDTNGPVGECLFTQNENGEIVYSDIIQCNMSADSVRALLQEWVYDLENIHNCSINNTLFGLTKICFEIEIPVGSELFNIETFGGTAASFIRHKSQITFRCTIDIREGRYRYTLNDFYTNRRSIRGDAKSEGPSNMIHWQRLNSLEKERTNLLNQSRVDKEEVAEYDSLIESEKISYQAEYDAVMYILEVLKEQRFTIISDF